MNDNNNNIPIVCIGVVVFIIKLTIFSNTEGKTRLVYTHPLTSHNRINDPFFVIIFIFNQNVKLHGILLKK